MAIDRKTLAGSYQGDQSKKVSVTKAWLKEVHYELAELDNLRKAEIARKAEEKRIATKMPAFESDLDKGQRSFDEGFDKFDKGFKQIFEGKGWKGIFGK